MWFHILQLSCPVKGASNWKGGRLTEGQDSGYPTRWEQPRKWSSETYYHRYSSAPAPEAHSPICRPWEEQVWPQVILMHLDYETGWRKPQLPQSPPACHDEHCRWLGDCRVRSVVKLLWAKLPALLWEDCSIWSRLCLKRAKLPHRVQPECTKAGCPRAVFGP